VGSHRAVTLVSAFALTGLVVVFGVIPDDNTQMVSSCESHEGRGAQLAVGSQGCGLGRDVRPKSGPARGTRARDDRGGRSSIVVSERRYTAGSGVAGLRS
jgi:hypothetical protein